MTKAEESDRQFMYAWNSRFFQMLLYDNVPLLVDVLLQLIVV